MYVLKFGVKWNYKKKNKCFVNWLKWIYNKINNVFLCFVKVF